jgi:hypothetical protein
MDMKTNIKIAAAAIGGLVLGAGLSGGFGIAPGVLHAQGTTPYYEVAEINVKDQAGYEKSGVERVLDAIKSNGGKQAHCRWLQQGSQPDRRAPTQPPFDLCVSQQGNTRQGLG